ncbi:MAG: bifunctional hydroxymethylpyrimidine kinase/phosphomethylpyrimidine kinase [Desulfohalobiaceae bacterium]|nr:bifunctional hydroxymethylpyrimidine kinase/phosphomethylpyrimidine kinase [Desulfohalobiaceae bacterium]
MNQSQEKQSKAPNYYRTLTIAGSDSSGGAGIQADLKTFSALGCYGMSVITALTAQNTTGVRSIHPVPASFVREQLQAVLDDLGTDAVKIGMLFSAEIIREVAGVLREYVLGRIVLDPVMVAQSGDKLLEDRAVEAIKSELMPLASLVTPNLPEAEVLLGRKIQDLKDMQAAARDLAVSHCQAVLIKGGHLKEKQSTDLLYLRDEDRFVKLESDFIQTKNNHGTGCTLSSAVAACLARGLDPESAVRRAKDYISEAIRAGAGYRLGRGHGPVHHFFAFWS